MVNLKPVDVVIIGGGWTGLTMAKELTSRTALSVAVLERGPSRSIRDYSASMDEVDCAIRHRMMQNITEETVTHRHTIRDRAAPVRQYGHFLPGTGVGGAGEHWTGFAERHTPDDFALATTMREKFGAARLPENLSIQDYPLTYDDLEPYYWRVEQMLGVGGKAGNLGGKLVAGGNIFEGPRSYEFPNPPHKKTYLMTVFEQASHELGYHPYTAARFGSGGRMSTRYQTAAYSTSHLQGGAIMGDAPERSVVNPWLQHWNAPNLWVIGASSFPQNSSAHPTITSLALTLRAADAMIDRYLKRPGALL